MSRKEEAGHDPHDERPGSRVRVPFLHRAADRDVDRLLAVELCARAAGAADGRQARCELLARNSHNLVATNALGSLHARLRGKRCRPPAAGAAQQIRQTTGQQSPEQRANEVDHLHSKALDTLDSELTEQEREQLDANLHGLAVTLRRDEETDDQAFDRVKASKYLIDFKHDEYWPFYHVDHKFGRIILTINTAHAFFDQLYNPLRELARKPAVEEIEEGSAADPKHVDEKPLIALELLLLSLARTQGVLGLRDEEAGRVFDRLRREWSDTYRIQLTG